MFPHNGNKFPGFFHTMETCFRKFSTQWKHVLGTFPHNGNMFRGGFPRCGKVAAGPACRKVGAACGRVGDRGEMNFCVGVRRLV